MESLVEIRSEDLETSPLKMADFCAVSPSIIEFIWPEVNNVVFLQVHSHVRHVGFSVGGSHQKVTFLPQSEPLQISEVLPPHFLFQLICCLHEKFGWDPFSGLGEIAGKIYLAIT